MSEKLPMTADGLAKLKSELENLKNSERPNIIKAIAEAREHGTYQRMQNITLLERNKVLLREEFLNLKIK